VFKKSKNRLNEQIRSHIEKLMEKCVIIEILTKAGDGLDEKHRKNWQNN
jgi:hypothetical protein